MPHRQFTVGDADYITRMNALANSLDRRLAQNIIVNGSFQVWQRGTSFASAASRVMTADRWSLYRNAFATGATVSRQTGSDPSRYCARVQRDSGNAGTGWIQLLQALTTENTYPLRGKRLGLRFRARCGANYSAASSAMVAQFVTGTGTDQYPNGYTGTATQASQSVTLTTSWQYFSVDLGVVGGTVTEAALGFYYTPVGTASTNDYFDVQEVQIVATSDSNVDVGDYPWRSFEDELLECQAYYQKSFAYATAPAQNAGTTSAVQGMVAAASAQTQYWHKFSPKMRGAPTVTTYNPSAANANWRNTTGASDATRTIDPAATAEGFGITAASGGSQNDVLRIHWDADAEL